MKWKRSTIHGSLLINALMALLITSISLMVLVNGLRVLSHVQSKPWQLQNGIDIAILQQRMVYATNIEVSYDKLHFDRDGQKWELKLIDDHLVLTPGTQYFASNIEELHFSINGPLVEMTMCHNDHTRTIALAYVN